MAAFRNTQPAQNQDNTSVNNTQLSTTNAENSIEEKEVTTFHDVETPNRFTTPMAQDNSGAGKMDDTHSIIQFLQRPVRIDQFELDTSSGDAVTALAPVVFTTANNQKPVKSYVLPSAVMTAGNKIQKLNNFKYFKANIRVKFVLNANPFTAGRFYITYSPYEDQVTDSRKCINSSRAGVTAYPGVEMDLQLDNSVEIDIPFASYREAYDLTENPEDYVKLYLFAITPLLGPSEGTTTRVDVSVFAWFTDIDLVIPTFDDIPGVTTSTIVKSVSPRSPEIVEPKKLRLARQLQDLEKSNSQGYKNVMSYLNSLLGNKRDVEMQVNAENKPRNKGPIQELASNISATAASVERIPVIGEVAKPVTTIVKWFSDFVGNVASIFGWSRPTNQDQACALVNLPGYGYAHFKGIDMGVPLALSSENELEQPIDVFPSGLDEMDLSYVCANPGIRAVVIWKTSDLVNVPISSSPGTDGAGWNEGVMPVGIGPFHYQSTPIGSTGNNAYVTDTVPCEYVSQLFTWWRATMCFKISVVKTAFHTGRLEILFNPGPYATTTSTSLWPNITTLTSKDTSNNYRYILDLTNDTEVTIRIPFVSHKMFMKTRGITGYFSDVSSMRQEYFDSMIGYLVIRPLSKLLAPPTVSDNVRVCIWKWAEDVELSCPVPGGEEPLEVFQIQSTVGPNKAKSRKPRVTRSVEMQINIGNKAEGNVVTFFDSASAQKQNEKAALNCVGERIKNLRILTRCFRHMNLEASATNDTPITGGIDTNEDNYGYDYMSFLSYMYRFYRGGMRFKIFTTAETGSVATSLHQNGSTIDINQQGPSHTTFNRLNPIHEVTVPFYCEYRKLPVSLAPARRLMTMQYTATGRGTYSFFRAGNDDFSYGWLMGTPQLAYIQSGE